jgi:hypothetical protein
MDDAKGLQHSEAEISEPGTLTLQVVRAGDATRRVGRPLVLTARRFLRICFWIEQGESAAEACRRELIGYASWRLHIQRNPKYQRRLKKAEAVRESFLKEYHLANIAKHAPRNILASLWYLERRFPAEFALRAVHRDQALTEKPIGNEIPAERLAEYGKLMLEFARGNEKRAAGKLVE